MKITMVHDTVDLLAKKLKPIAFLVIFALAGGGRCLNFFLMRSFNFGKPIHFLELG